jgi:flagellar basal-body rod protein FlgF
MQNTTTIALSRLTAQQRAMDVTAANIANASTPGYRGGRTLFSDWLVRTPGGDKIAFTQDRATYRDTAQGPLSHTGNVLDIALLGPGYLTVATPAGPRLSRGGHFELNAQGGIIDGTGNALLDTKGSPLRITTADTQITIAGDGTVSSENGRIGRIGVVKPDDEMRLRSEGGRLFFADGPTQPVTNPKLSQGVIENSNIQPALELTRMMNALREFQFASELIQSESERQQGAIDKLTQKRT